MLPLKHQTVVVPTDFSAASLDAVQSGFARTNAPGGLHVIHFVLPLDYYRGDDLLLQRPTTDRLAAARQRLEELIREAGAEGARAQVLEGEPGLGTVDYAKDVAAELIVVPSHGYYGVKRLLLGSTAERILRHAHCPVLVLRRQNRD